MKILVTGGSGFIGSHIVEHYQGKAEITVLDNFRTGYKKNLEGFDVNFIEGDICDRAAVKNAPITIFGNGEQTRDFIYVKDIVAANVFMAQSDNTGVYNVAYGKKITINEWAKLIIKLTGSTSDIVHHEERTGDVKHTMASTSKLLATGFKPTGNFANGLETTIDFFAKSTKEMAIKCLK